MKEACNSSPFAALSGQEQKEKWICWQAQKNEQRKAEIEASVAETNQESVLVATEKNAGRTMPTHHSQYLTVLKRMTMAQRRTGAYQSCD